ncbi:hypothetical protein KUCAC02_033709, partial [Chaenocephalus aceratus]
RCYLPKKKGEMGNETDVCRGRPNTPDQGFLFFLFDEVHSPLACRAKSSTKTLFLLSVVPGV